jgi:uncharacterized protein (TIGR02001 family)
LRRLWLCVGLVLLASDAAAQISGSVAVLSDIRFRGISLTDRGPGAEAEVTYDHASGLYAGALVETVRLDGANPELGAQAYAGYARALSERVALDVGFAGYFYPASAVRGTYSFNEAFAGVSLDGAAARLHYSDDYFGSGVPAWYAEIDGAVKLTRSLALVGHLGYLVRGPQNYPQLGAAPPSQWDAKLGVATEWLGLNFELSVVATNIPAERCPLGDRACAPGVVFAVSREF